MFYRQASDQYIQEGQPFEIDGTSYPANWLNCSTPEQKADLGLVEVTNDNQPEDDRFYWVSATLNGAVRTYTNTPKDLAGLKTQWTSQIKHQAYVTLQSTDYIEIRNLRDATYKPDWITWRESVRTACAKTIAAIDAAVDVPSLQAAIQVNLPKDPDNQDK